MSIPRGFYETAEECDDTSPAFVRGILIDQAVYDKLTFDEKLKLSQVPRLTLYGGPFQTRQIAEAWDQYLFFWASQNGKLWFSLGTPCVVSSYRIGWPADSSMQWTLVKETEQPRRVARQWDGKQYKYVWV